MLDLALETCCFGRNRVVYDGPYKHIERYYVKNASFVMPVQTSLSGDKYFGYPYIHMLSVSSAGFFAPPVQMDPIVIGKTLTSSILNTWPMLIIVFTLSLAAGVCVWVLVSFYIFLTNTVFQFVLANNSLFSFFVSYEVILNKPTFFLHVLKI